MKVQKRNDGLILDGVDDDLGDKIIWQQQHQAPRPSRRMGGNGKAIGFGN
jgi:hypothetical protein